MRLTENLKRVYAEVCSNPILRERVPSTDIELVHIYKQQVRVLYESAGRPLTERLERMVTTVYEPHQAMWGTLSLPDESSFRDGCERLMKEVAQPDHPGLRMALQCDFVSHFAEISQGSERLLGFRPQCIWHLVFAPHSDMGGDRVNMWANLSHLGQADDPIQSFKFLLPHEFSHIVLLRFWEGKSPPRFTLLLLCIEEGLCSYFNYEYWNRAHSPAANLMYSNSEWDWCLANERKILARMLPQFSVGDYQQMEMYHMGNQEPWPGAPKRLAYFVGFRICQCYVEGNGSDSWKEVYSQAPETTLRKSGYLERFGLKADSLGYESES